MNEKLRSVVTIPLKCEIWQKDYIYKKMEIARNVYNVMLRKELKELRKMERDTEYISAYEIIKKNYKEKPAGFKKNEEFKKATEIINAKRMEYGFTEFSFMSEVGEQIKYFKEHIGTVIGKYTIAKPMWSAFERYFFGDGNRIKFKCKGDIKSLTSIGKSEIRLLNKNGDRIDKYSGEDEIFVNIGKQCGRNIIVPINMKAMDDYKKEMLSREIKLLSVVRRTEKGRDNYYLQACVVGEPAVIRDKYGNEKHFRNTGTVVVIRTLDKYFAMNSKEFKVFDLSVKNYQDKISELQKYLDTSRRISNPENYNEDGTIKKGRIIEGKRTKLQWSFSNNYKKARKELAELMRKETVARKLNAEIISNAIIAMGNEIYINTLNVKKAQMRIRFYNADEEVNFKHNQGDKIKNNAPSMIAVKLKQKLASDESSLYNEREIENKTDNLSDEEAKKICKEIFNRL